MWNDTDCSPETVEEQREHFVQGQSRQHLNAVLAQARKVRREEDQARGERIGGRDAARIGIQAALDEPSLKTSPSSWTNTGAFSAGPAQELARPARRSRLAFVLKAALLVTVVLVGSALWAGCALREPGGVAAHPPVTPQFTQTHALTSTPPVAPSGRATQVVFDDKMNALLLFSGQDYISPALDDTWSWDGSTWMQLHPPHAPTPRTAAALAYDPSTQQVVLFGGMSAVGNTPILGDTWTWNGIDWTQQHPASAPPACAFAMFAYDAATGQLVLFGGKHDVGFTPSMNDTWVWTGSNWVQQYPTAAPSARSQASLAYDAATRNLVLFGGGDLGPTTLNDTWIWTGSNWVQQHPTTVPDISVPQEDQTVAFEHSGMVYNPAMRQLLLTLFGAGDALTTQADWAWDGSNWTKGNTTGPAVDEGSVFYDAHLQTVFEMTNFVNAASGTVENTLWKWTGHMWVVVERW